MVVLGTSKIEIERERDQIWNKGVSKTSDNIHIKVKIHIAIQEPPESSNSEIQDSKVMDVLCTFKIKIESQNSDHGYIKDQ